MSRAMCKWISITFMTLFTLGPAAELSAAHSGDQGYTAQRRPRVAVSLFRDTNAVADSEKYGESVSAMLVTYLKRESQFVVVERQDVQSVIDEWRRNQEGETKEPLTGHEIELLERIDVILQGNVTVLGGRVEIDGKLLSRTDGRIITAAQRSGPIDCLRQIVDRLGIAIESRFLTPYYGKIQLTYYDPENVHFLLTPILTPNALDEEKPPAELDSTVLPGEDRDRIRKWIANPATYTIENVLAGWYTLRLRREGYEDVKISNSLLRAGETSKGFEVRYHKAGGMIPLKRAPEGERFQDLVVRVDSLATNEIDLTERGITMRKKQGGLNFTILNENKEPLPAARIMMRSVALDINPEYQLSVQEQLKSLEKAKKEEEENESDVDSIVSDSLKAAATLNGEDGDQQMQRALYMTTLALVGKGLEEKGEAATPAGEKVACDDFEEDLPHVFDYGRKTVYSGDTFDLTDFKGGELYFEEYRGESLPIGIYEIAVWAPRLEIQKSIVVVSEDSGEGKSRKIELKRRRKDVLLVGRSDNRIQFRGMETRLEKVYGTDTSTGLRTVSLPVDLYDMGNDAKGFAAWNRQLDLRPVHEEPPTFAEAFDPDSAGTERSPERIVLPTEIRIKNTVWVAGRYEGFRPYPHTFYNPRIGQLLDQILEDTSFYDWSSLDAEDDKLAALADQLRDIDLLILDEDDMSRIRVFPELAGVIRRYVEGGHSLMAFIAREGDYQSVLGRPLKLKKRFSPSTKVRLNFESGEPKFEYDVDLGWSRAMPKLKERKQLEPNEWQVVSYTKRQRKPRVVEAGGFQNGGYVLVWFETSRAWARWQSFVGRESGMSKILRPFRYFFKGESRDPRTGGMFAENGLGGASEPPDAAGQNGEAPDVDAEGAEKPSIEDELRIAEAMWEARLANNQISIARAQLQGRALLWAEYLMFRRLDGGEEKVEEFRKEILALETY